MINEDNFHNLNGESRMYKVRQKDFLAVLPLATSLPTATLIVDTYYYMTNGGYRSK